MNKVWIASHNKDVFSSDYNSYMSCYSEGATVTPPENRILNPDIEPAVRFELRENIKNALSVTLALLRITPEPTFHLGAGTFQITQFINPPRLNHPALVRLAIVPFRVDSVEISIILGVY